MHVHWTATSALSGEQRGQIEAALAGRPWLQHDYRGARADLDAGLDNCAFIVGRAGRGLALVVAYQGVDVVTVVGELDDDELGAACTRKPVEVRAPAGAATVIAAALGERLEKRGAVRVCQRSGPPPAALAACQRVEPRDFLRLRAFHAEHASGSLLSPWMIGLPHVRVDEGGEIVAAAGTVSMHSGAAHIGHVVVHPEYRDRGLARRLGASLVGELAGHGVSVVRLLAHADGGMASADLESLGFEVVDELALLRASAGLPL